MNVIIPMAGLGSRFSTAGYILPKPLIDVNGSPMITQAIQTLGIDGTYYCLIRKDKYADLTSKAILAASPTAKIIEIDYITEGAASSVMLFESLIDHDDEVIVANCDQIMKWDSNAAMTALRKFDGGVVTFSNTDPKHSYVEMIGDTAQRFAEKKVISNIALTGIHYWKKSKFLFSSVAKMIEKNDRAANGEFYVSTTYNYLLADHRIGNYHITESEFFPVGTPYDLNKYLNGSK
jgi:NDP-sugar pyrophosphorylase family protein